MDFAGIYENGEHKSYTLSEAAPNGVKDVFWKTVEGKALDDTFEIVQQMIDFGDDE